MTTILRSFRLGIINLIGVTVPGLIVLFLVCFGYLAPVVLLIQDLTTGPDEAIASGFPNIPPIGIVSPAIAVSAILVLAYIIGYIFRLSTPDDLDRISTKYAIKKMGGVKAAYDDHWVHHGEPKNKFPYFHFSDYLNHRRHYELVPHVDWDEEVRSKTSVNKMKLTIGIRSPQLSAIIESNEAHIRLLFGTWLAAKLCIYFVVIGLIAALIGLARCKYDNEMQQKAQDLLFPYSVWIVVCIIMITGSVFAICRIRNLFHYRRVRELFDVVACYHLACEGFDAAGRPRN